MTYHKEEYTLHNGNKIYVQYDDHNICQITKECLEMLLDLYQQGRADAINDYYNELNEKINTDTRLKDTIKDIHDNVAREMYCKGIDELCDEISTYGMYDEYGNVIDVLEIAKRLKEQKNDNK